MTDLSSISEAEGYAMRIPLYRHDDGKWKATMAITNVNRFLEERRNLEANRRYAVAATISRLTSSID